ncbi:hypothetical protein NX059_009771 [Plenodomus lindquistii]|nr:hypothetical protein NX059_009771 [Plenodomus lindquistii]
MYLQFVPALRKKEWKLTCYEVPDGSSVDISRVIRFDYRDPIYARLAKEAFDLWLSHSIYQDSFYHTANAFVSSKPYGRSHVDKCTDVLDGLGLPWERLSSKAAIKEMFPVLYGEEAQSDLYGYCNRSSGWADARKAVVGLRDQCIEAGVSFICGARGTVVSFEKDAAGNILTAKTASGSKIQGDYFILSAGAWSSKLADMYSSTIATAQVLAFIKLTPEEMVTLKEMPLLIEYDSGWFCFPPHEDTGVLKIAVHGWGYTRTTEEEHLSLPPSTTRSRRTNFAPDDGVARLRAGLRLVLPSLADRAFDRVAICWYSDTPTGDFIIDYHPDHPNLFLATGGSGHAFKFLPVLGKYVVQGFQRSLEGGLAAKWQFKTEYRDQQNEFHGDGSRGGPLRRELTMKEKANL